MEKLENRIVQILRDDRASIALSKVTIQRISKQIVQEVKDSEEVQDIAIAFAKWKDGLLFKQVHIAIRDGSNVQVNKIPDEELFKKFITNYYK